MHPRIAIVCDWLVSRGGAERVISTLSDMFPDAPIFTSLYNKDALPEFSSRDVRMSFLQGIPGAQSKHAFFLPLMPHAFEQFDLSAFDIVISSAHSCAKGVITKPRTLHISYCHSPMRYCWENSHEYFEQYGLPAVLRGRAKKILHELRMWDRLAADRVDFFVANSRHIQQRIEKYYRRSASVIYPPVETEKFRPSKKHGQYFVAVGRLTPYKRFDLLIDAFNEMKLPLVIVGVGKDEKILRRRAGRFITFLGAIPDAELEKIYQGALALVFPQNEDFGITVVEAMSCGKPVIAFAAGGALETVIPGKTGLFFDNQSIPSLKKAILEFQAMKWDSETIRNHAELFDKKVFLDNLKRYIDEKWQIWRKDMA